MTFSPRFLEPHERAANAAVLEHERLHFVHGTPSRSAQRVVDLLRIRFAARRLHDLADEEAEHLLLTGAELLDLRRIRGDDFRDELVDARRSPRSARARASR